MKKATTMRHILGAMMLGVLISTAAPAMAQGGMQMRTPEQRAQNQTDMMKQKLTLDDGQTSKVQAINLKYAQQADPIMKGDGERAEKMKQMTTLQQAKEQEMKGVLSDDQFKKYQQMELAIRQRFSGGNGRVGGSGDRPVKQAE